MGIGRCWMWRATSRLQGMRRCLYHRQYTSSSCTPVGVGSSWLRSLARVSTACYAWAQLTEAHSYPR